VRKIPNTVLEEVLTELSATTADLAKSVDIAVLRMVLRSKLSAAIADAGKAEHAAEALHTVASAEIAEYEQACPLPESRGGVMKSADT
jgi:hypothetical protein